MNKLMGFYELKESNLPTIDWNEYTGEQNLSDKCLWTIRTAVLKGNDLNLPRYIGVDSIEANKRAQELYDIFKNKGMVVYYPFFIAEKSGTLNVYNDRIVIEAVKDDLWNLVSKSDVDVTIMKNILTDKTEIRGNENFLSPNELKDILSNVPLVRGMFRSDIIEGKSVLLEWSFAYDCKPDGSPVGDKYLVFYEARTV